MAKVKIEPELQIECEECDVFNDGMSSTEPVFQPKIEKSADFYNVRMVKVKIEPTTFEPKMEKSEDFNKKMFRMVKVKIEPELQIESEKCDDFDHEMSSIEATFQPKIEKSADFDNARMVKVKIEPKMEKSEDFNDKMFRMVKVKIQPGLEAKIEKSEDFNDDTDMTQLVNIKIEADFEPIVKSEKIEDYGEEESVGQPKYEIVVVTKRWLHTVPFGSVVEGSPFVPFKMPFVGTYLQPCPLESRFDIAELVKAFPNIGLVVDLTNNLRTYRVSDLMAFGVEYVNIPVKLIPKNELPSDELLNRFIETCSRYTTKNAGKLIGVHDLLGTRATGYMICKALEMMGFSMQQAMKRFKIARGHSIEPVLGSVLNGSREQWVPQTPKMRRLKRLQKNRKRRKAERKAEKNRSNHWQRLKLEPKYERF